jgi:signal transduction histidine kinase
MSAESTNQFSRVIRGVRKYQFEFKHLMVLFLVLVLFQIAILYMNQRSVDTVFLQSQQWYQQDAAERIANLTATSLEMLLESKASTRRFSAPESRQIVQDFNIIFSQQQLDKNVQSVCVLFDDDAGVTAVDNGKDLFAYWISDSAIRRSVSWEEQQAIALYRENRDRLIATEQTMTVVEGHTTFHVFVPFVPRGEYLGTVYMKSTPDLSFLTREMSEMYGRTALVYSGLILASLVAMFLISSRTVRERNRAQQALFEEQSWHLAEQIHHQKETIFAKRIYHTHHKAEKIGGFIKEDLRSMTPETMEEVRERINKYASFVARVIYDMKWYDPPIHTIRGALFSTNVNDVIRFLVQNLFQRLPDGRTRVRFDLDLDPALPPVQINEYVLWEVLEPIIQNSLDHGGRDGLVVTVRTRHTSGERRSVLIIEDNGNGIDPVLLERDANGIQKVFHEHSSGGTNGGKEHSGYGCYLAHEIATQRCGWKLEAQLCETGGARFIFEIPH